MLPIAQQQPQTGSFLLVHNTSYLVQLARLPEASYQLCIARGQLAALTNKWHIIKTALHFCLKKNCSKWFKLWLCDIWLSHQQWCQGWDCCCSIDMYLLSHYLQQQALHCRYKLQQPRQFSTNFPSWIWSRASCLFLGFYKTQLPASVYSVLQVKSRPISSVLWVTFLYFLFSPACS